MRNDEKVNTQEKNETQECMGHLPSLSGLLT